MSLPIWYSFTEILQSPSGNVSRAGRLSAPTNDLLRHLQRVDRLKSLNAEFCEDFLEVPTVHTNIDQTAAVGSYDRQER